MENSENGHADEACSFFMAERIEKQGKEKCENAK